MKSALDLGHAGSDVFNTVRPKTNNGVWQAQQDLISYLFEGALHGSADWNTVAQRFTSVLKYNVNNGNPEATPAKSTYPSLTVGSHVNSPFGTSAHDLLHPFATLSS
jgi:hypothetical protein